MIPFMWIKICDLSPPEGVDVFFAWSTNKETCDCEYQRLRVSTGYFYMNNDGEEKWNLKIPFNDETGFSALGVHEDNVKFWAPIPKFIWPNENNIAELN